MIARHTYRLDRKGASPDAPLAFRRRLPLPAHAAKYAYDANHLEGYNHDQPSLQL
jgi:hypothetical protein